MENNRRKMGKGWIITAVVIVLLALLGYLGWRWSASWLLKRNLADIEEYERGRQLALAREKLAALRALGTKAKSGALVGGSEGISFLLDEGVLNTCLGQFRGLEGESGRGDSYQILDARLQCLDGLAVATFSLDIQTRYEGINGRAVVDALLTLVPDKPGLLTGRFRIISVIPDLEIYGRKAPAASFLRYLAQSQLDQRARLKIPDLAIPLSLEGAVPLPKVEKTSKEGALTVELPARSVGYRVEIEDAGFYKGFIRAAASQAILITGEKEEGVSDGKAQGGSDAGDGEAKGLAAPGGKTKDAPPSSGVSVEEVDASPIELDPLAQDPAAFEAELARLERALDAEQKKIDTLDLPGPPGMDAEVRCGKSLISGLMTDLADAWLDDFRITIDNWENVWEKEQKLLGRTFQNHADITHADAEVDFREIRLVKIEPGRLTVHVVIEGSGRGQVVASMFGLTPTLPIFMNVSADQDLVFTMALNDIGELVISPEPAAIPLDVDAEIHFMGVAVNLKPPVNLRAEKVIRPVKVPLAFARTVTIPEKMKRSDILQSREVEIHTSGLDAPRVTPEGNLLLATDLVFGAGKEVR